MMHAHVQQILLADQGRQLHAEAYLVIENNLN